MEPENVVNMSPHKSWVWLFFKVNNINASKVNCTICRKDISRGAKQGNFNTTNLIKHLKSKHANELLTENRKQEDEDKNLLSEINKMKMQLRPTSPSCKMAKIGSHTSNSDSKDGSSVLQEADSSYKKDVPHHLLHNNHPSLVLQSLADDESFMDVTLTASGTAIKAHKSVLSAMSPYFRDVLKANPSPHPIIVMPRDVTFQELKNIIGYIYKGEITIDGSELKSFLKTADTLQIVGLMSSETDSNLDKEAALPNCGASKEKGQKRKRGRALSDVPLREGVDRDDPLNWEATDMTLVKEELSDVSELENIWLPETEDFSSATTSFSERKDESEPKRRRASSSLPLLTLDDSSKGSLVESPHQSRRVVEESPHQTRRAIEESPHQTRRAVRAKGKKISPARTSNETDSPPPTSSEVNPPSSLDDKESVFTEIGTCDDAFPPATKTKQTLDS